MIAELQTLMFPGEAEAPADGVQPAGDPSGRSFGDVMSGMLGFSDESGRSNSQQKGKSQDEPALPPVEDLDAALEEARVLAEGNEGTDESAEASEPKDPPTPAPDDDDAESVAASSVAYALVVVESQPADPAPLPASSTSAREDTDSAETPPLRIPRENVTPERAEWVRPEPPVSGRPSSVMDSERSSETSTPASPPPEAPAMPVAKDAAVSAEASESKAPASESPPAAQTPQPSPSLEPPREALEAPSPATLREAAPAQNETPAVQPPSPPTPDRIEVQAGIQPPPNPQPTTARTEPPPEAPIPPEARTPLERDTASPTPLRETSVSFDRPEAPRQASAARPDTDVPDEKQKARDEESSDRDDRPVATRGSQSVMRPVSVVSSSGSARPAMPIDAMPIAAPPRGPESVEFAQALAKGLGAGAEGQVQQRVERLNELIGRLDEHVVGLIRGNDKTLSITLIPRNLGRVTLNCREEGERVAVELVAETPGVRHLLQQQEQPLRAMLAQSGFQMTSFDVKTGEDSGEAPFPQRHRTAGEDAADDEDAGFFARKPRPRAVETARERSNATGGIWMIA